MSTRPQSGRRRRRLLHLLLLSRRPRQPDALRPDRLHQRCDRARASMLVSSLAFAVLLPTDRAVAAPASDERPAPRSGARLPRARHGSRDRASKAARATCFRRSTRSRRTAPDLQRDALQWLFAVLEVGHAVIDLRHELAAPGVDTRETRVRRGAVRSRRRSTPSRVSSIARTPARFDAALTSTAQAIADLQTLLDTERPPREERHRLQRILSQLHFIRTALLDPQSPLGPYSGADNVREHLMPREYRDPRSLCADDPPAVRRGRAFHLARRPRACADRSLSRRVASVAVSRQPARVCLRAARPCRLWLSLTLKACGSIHPMH